MIPKRPLVGGLVFLVLGVGSAHAPAGGLEQRVAALVAALTLDEKIALVHSRFGMPLRGRPMPTGALASAGFVPGVPRLGIPPLQESDAGLGVANPTNADFDATALPSGLALAASCDPGLAERAGAAIGAEARDKGFSVLLAGGAELTREPRGGRDFEYAGEDPLLTGAIVGATIAGIQSNHIVSTLKHFVLNAQETGRVVIDARLGEAAARESDLLAFELALERGRPGAVMTAYNSIDGRHASENARLLTDILKRDWGFGGWVMSDWGGTHSTEAAALAGLDQESGADLDDTMFFDAPLKQAVGAGRVHLARLDDMVARQLRARIQAGTLDDPPRPGSIRDLDAHAAVAEEVAARGLVLLKKAGGALPLSPTAKRLLVVGGHADVGVLSGGGSSQVVPKGRLRFEGDPPGAFYGQPKLYDPSSPLAALRAALPHTHVDFLAGDDAASAARAARDADAVIVFADAWRNESRDVPDLALPNGQDALIAKLAAANPRTIVVLETGGPVTMPWLGSVAGIIEAWYPGERGGEAIADVLTGRADPGGRLPMTFPAAESQLPRPHGIDPATTTSNPGEPIKGGPIVVDYDVEGADVGYKWFLRTKAKPLFPFGFGLSYTRFATSGLAAQADGSALAFDVRNVGSRAGRDVAQVYVDGPGFTRRLAGFAALDLAPGETRHVSVKLDPRLLARWDAPRGWRIAPGRYTIAVRPD
ncbi:MAG: glycoside hydrolase family 3 C-terminal domain-containing protein, partial [Beijerinckiaceae bacterium]|nr:glycoside hydrolase family 3 C-terminal domain-containing protein [Beijerinckiaceae bacterium]